MERVTVCIPAYNEEDTIEECVRSVVNQRDVIIDEILVGVNGSIDNTEKIVNKLKRDYHYISIVNSEKGKANAWNAMNSIAKNNLRVFIDGDCRIEEYSIQNLVKSLKNFTVIGSTLEYDIDNVGILSKIVHFPNRLYSNSYDICGAMYLLNYEKFKKRLSEFGINEMPKELIAEDRWIAVVSNDVNISRDSIVITNACSIKDQIKRVKRMYISEKQFEKYEKYIKEFNKSHKKENDRLLKQFQSLSLKEKFLYLFIIPIKKILNMYINSEAKKYVAKEEGKEYIWEKIYSSRK